MSLYYADISKWIGGFITDYDEFPISKQALATLVPVKTEINSKTKVVGSVAISCHMTFAGEAAYSAPMIQYSQAGYRLSCYSHGLDLDQPSN